LVGRDPGEEEDMVGRPFVGRLGKDLKKTLESVGFSLDDCRFTNVVRCHTPNNIGPTKDQVSACLPYLLAEIQACEPKAIVCLGKEASQAVLGTHEKLGNLRGRPLRVEIGGVTYPLFCTHHPARLYHQNSLVQEFAADLQLVSEVLSGALCSEEDLVVEVLSTVGAIDSVLDYLESTQLPFSLDFETVNTYPYLATSRVLCVGFCFDRDFAYTIPVSYGLPGDGTEFGEEQVLHWETQVFQRIGRLLSLPNAKCAHNAPFEYLWSKVFFGVAPANLTDDTILLHYCMDERPGTHGLDKLASRVGLSGYDDLMRPYYSHPYNLAPWDIVSRYNGLDCIVTFRLWGEMKPLVYKEAKLKRVYEKLLLPSISRFSQITENGAAIDPDIVERAISELQSRLDAISSEIQALAEEAHFSEKFREKLEQDWEKRAEQLRDTQKVDFEAWVTEGNDPEKFRWKKPAKIMPEQYAFNPGSTPKLAFLLFELLNLPTKKKSIKTQKPATDAEVLENLASLHPLPERILESRSLSREINTYGGMLREYTVEGLIHPGFRMFTTVTGRPSSADPPLQNFPKKSPLREAFVSRWGENGILVEIDQSQMELRVMASLSGDPTMRLAYCGDPETGQKPQDLHRLTASRVFGVPQFDTAMDDRSAEDAFQRFHLDAPTYLRAASGLWMSERDPRDCRLSSILLDVKERGAAVLDQWKVSRDVYKDIICGDSLIDNSNFMYGLGLFEQKYYLGKDYVLYQRGVTKNQRDQAKTVGFGIIYGISAAGLSKQLRISEMAANDLIQGYFRQFPRVQSYIRSVIQRVHRDKQIVSMFGRVRRLPEVDSSEPEIVAEAERQAVNLTIQSSASDITVLAYYRLCEWLWATGLKSVVWDLIHDAINLDCPLDEWVRVSKKTISLMEEPLYSWMTVPLVAEASIGTTWKECKDEANNVTAQLRQGEPVDPEK
jgi:uracil-DNA glycosylase family 4